MEFQGVLDPLFWLMPYPNRITSDHPPELTATILKTIKPTIYLYPKYHSYKHLSVWQINKSVRIMSENKYNMHANIKLMPDC